MATARPPRWSPAAHDRHGHAGVLDGLINGDWFEGYVGEVLAPELRPDDVVVMDNLSSHKHPAVRDRIEAAGATLCFLPP